FRHDIIMEFAANSHQFMIALVSRNHFTYV
ncbi:unnamed protein product, partial [marine sediment metagenome]